jgi:hypothetical protein
VRSASGRKALKFAGREGGGELDVYAREVDGSLILGIGWNCQLLATHPETVLHNIFWY